MVIDVRKGIHIILPHTIPASISKGGKLVWVEVLLEVIRATEDKEESKAEEDVIDVEVVGCDLPKPLNSLCYEEVVLLLDAQSDEFRLAYAKLRKEVDSILHIDIGLIRKIVEFVLSSNPTLIEMILHSSAILSLYTSGNIGI